MSRLALANVSDLSDERLEAHLRDTIEHAMKRPAMKPALRQLLAGAIGELKAEMLVTTDMTADEIAEACNPVLVFPAAAQKTSAKCVGLHTGLHVNTAQACVEQVSVDQGETA